MYLTNAGGEVERVASGAIGTTQIADRTVTNVKLANDFITIAGREA